MSLAETLAEVAELSRRGAEALPEPARTVLALVSLVTGAGSALARAGKDPTLEITRILTADEHLAGVYERWGYLKDKKFGRLPSEPIEPSPDTLPAPGSKEDLAAIYEDL